MKREKKQVASNEPAFEFFAMRLDLEPDWQNREVGFDESTSLMSDAEVMLKILESKISLNMSLLFDSSGELFSSSTHIQCLPKWVLARAGRFVRFVKRLRNRSNTRTPRRRGMMNNRSAQTVVCKMASAFLYSTFIMFKIDITTTIKSWKKLQSLLVPVDEGSGTVDLPLEMKKRKLAPSSMNELYDNEQSNNGTPNEVPKVILVGFEADTISRNVDTNGAWTVSPVGKQPVTLNLNEALAQIAYNEPNPLIQAIDHVPLPSPIISSGTFLGSNENAALVAVATQQQSFPFRPSEILSNQKAVPYDPLHGKTESEYNIANALMMLTSPDRATRPSTNTQGRGPVNVPFLSSSFTAPSITINTSHTGDLKPNIVQDSFHRDLNAIDSPVAQGPYIQRGINISNNEPCGHGFTSPAISSQMPLGVTAPSAETKPIPTYLALLSNLATAGTSEIHSESSLSAIALSMITGLAQMPVSHTLATMVSVNTPPPVVAFSPTTPLTNFATTTDESSGIIDQAVVPGITPATGSNPGHVSTIVPGVGSGPMHVSTAIWNYEDATSANPSLLLDAHNVVPASVPEVGATTKPASARIGAPAGTITGGLSVSKNVVSITVPRTEISTLGCTGTIIAGAVPSAHVAASTDFGSKAMYNNVMSNAPTISVAATATSAKDPAPSAHTSPTSVPIAPFEDIAAATGISDKKRDEKTCSTSIDPQQQNGTSASSTLFDCKENPSEQTSCKTLQGAIVDQSTLPVVQEIIEPSTVVPKKKNVELPWHNHQFAKVIPVKGWELPSDDNSSDTHQWFDSRTCCLCNISGDDDGGLESEGSTETIVEDKYDTTNGSGRLLPLPGGGWVHSGCAIWSSEVWENPVGGILNGVTKATGRGTKLRCFGCGQTGATLGCHRSNCHANYHFPCAKAAGVVFTSTHKLFCDVHKQFAKDDLVTEFPEPMKILRVVDEKEAEVDPALCYRSGSLIVHSLGKIEHTRDGFHSKHYITPPGFSSTRIFWSFVKPKTRTVYIMRIVRSPQNSAFYIVTAADAPAETFQGDNVSKVYGAIMKRVMDRNKGSFSHGDLFSVFPMARSKNNRNAFCLNGPQVSTPISICLVLSLLLYT